MNRHLATLVLLLSLVTMCSTLDTLTPNQPLRDSNNKNQTLISANGTFEAGFFTPSEYSTYRYFGIWYKNISPTTVVWVANRATPLTDNTTGVLQVDPHGNFFLNGGTFGPIWFVRGSHEPRKLVVVQLLDTGNLVVKDGEQVIWQSFDEPGDTLLPGMKLGIYSDLTCWRSLTDPTPGEYSLHVDTNGLPQLFIIKQDTKIFRLGSWNGVSFTGIIEEENGPFGRYTFIVNKEEVSYEFKEVNSSVMLRSTLNPDGYLVLYRLSKEKSEWKVNFPALSDSCEKYAFCGVNALCQVTGCECLTGFKEDSTRNISGCVRIRNATQDCNKGIGDSFHIYHGVKLPDTSSSWYNNSISLKDCEQLCLKNCSCTGYSKLSVSATVSGCLQWFSDFVDMRKMPEGGQDFYVRVTAASKPASKADSHSKKKKLIKILVGCGVFIMGSILIGLLLFYIKKKWFTQPETITETITEMIDRRDDDDIDLPTFDFLTISHATNDFSESNKLGQGGFGPVFKGILEDGQEVAVKRLSSTSRQGVEEFKNEVRLIAKLQHRNLVKLLGYSIQQEEKLLIYEFMPNGSLDHLLFDSTKRTSLGWAVRFKIVEGIARGLLYLHRDSRLNVIHRDLKAGNVLLDSNMEPKISDFGTARTFDQNQDEVYTNRMMGTFGYMSPEYAGQGSFSIKSDVYSFGVLVLEITSGRKNTAIDPHQQLNLIGQAWKLWTENRPADFIDDILINDPTSPTEVLRYMHIGLLCVQQSPDDRPDMSRVLLMLNDESILPEPREPGFYIAEHPPIQGDSGSGAGAFSLISSLGGR